jgi:hypothetical protein
MPIASVVCPHAEPVVSSVFVASVAYSHFLNAAIMIQQTILMPNRLINAQNMNVDSPSWQIVSIVFFQKPLGGCEALSRGRLESGNAIQARRLGARLASVIRC